ncbi:MAG: amino acid adenylation domain-containing protein [Rhodospirillaceae bacterium]|nr:amino acid adenylation domain-containing protein [Rhodospirillaceae bacterium]
MPLDPHYPVDRLVYMLEDSAAPIVLAQERHLAVHGFLEGGEHRVITTERQDDSGLDDRRPENINRSDDLAFTVYTSGSTGRPKGVECSHACMLSRFRWMWDDFPFTDDDVCCAKTSLNFVDSIWEMLGGLLQGVATVVANDTTARDPGALLRLVGDHGVTRLIVVPALATALIEEATRLGSGLESLRFLTFSGEPLSSDLARQARALNDGMTVLNLYGASETAADATFCRVRDRDLEGTKVPIGGPIGAMRLHVLNDAMEPVAQGAEGELFVSGPGLARGYRNLPEMTAEKFLENPFVDPEAKEDSEHQRLFRTGDMVRQRDDGGLDYVGRKDFQIKIRGMRIEPGEIETVLREHPDVRNCAVAAAETGVGKQLAAFYVPGGDVSTHELRAFVAARVADYMVPSLFIAHDALPLLPNGKLDRRSLKVPDDFRADTEYVAPATQTEETLVVIWQDVLGLDRIGTADDFFEIGGDSIQAFRVAAQAKEAGLELAPQDLEDASTVAALAMRAQEPSRIEVEERESGAMPLSPMQRYYFTWAKPNPHKFNVVFMARLGEAMDVPRLKTVLRHLVDHHGALRLRFGQDGDGAWQQRFVEDEGVYAIPVHEISMPQGEAQAQLDFIKSGIERLHDTLDIETGPVMAVGLFRGQASDDDHFFLVMHELVTDAMSLQVVLEDLRRGYEQLGRGEAIALPARTTTYRQWVDKVIDYARTGAAQDQWDTWLEAGRDVSGFPEDDPRGGALQSDIVPHGFDVLDAETVRRARERLQGGFQNRLLDSIFTALLLTARDLSGQRNLIFHKVAHGRETAIRDADVSRTVGWFITHTPVTFRLPDGEPVEGGALALALETVGSQLRAFPDNGLGHSALRYYADDPDVTELAQYDEVKTLFQYIGDVWEHNYDGVLFQVPDASLTDVPDTVAAENLADYHLHIYAYLMDDAFRMKFFYTQPNYRAETISRMGDLFCGHMQRLMAL